MTMMRVLILLTVMALAGADKKRYDNYKVYSVVTATQAQVDLLAGMRDDTTLDFWLYRQKLGGESQIMVGPDNQAAFVKKMTDAGMTPTVLNENVQIGIDQEQMAQEEHNTCP